MTDQARLRLSLMRELQNIEIFPIWGQTFWWRHTHRALLELKAACGHAVVEGLAPTPTPSSPTSGTVPIATYSQMHGPITAADTLKEPGIDAMLVRHLDQAARQETSPGTSMDPPWKQYRRTGLSEMRPYVPGENLTGISVNPVDTPAAGGMIARNPQNHADQWYVAPEYFRENLEAVEEEE